MKKIFFFMILLAIGILLCSNERTEAAVKTYNSEIIGRFMDEAEVWVIGDFRYVNGVPTKFLLEYYNEDDSEIEDPPRFGAAICTPDGIKLVEYPDIETDVPFIVENEFYYVLDRNNHRIVTKYNKDGEVLLQKKLKIINRTFNIHGSERQIYKASGNTVYLYDSSWGTMEDGSEKEETTIRSINLKNGKEKELGKFNFIVRGFDNKFVYGFRQNEDMNRISFYRYSMKTGKTKKMQVKGFSDIEYFEFDSNYCFYNNQFLLEDLNNTIYYGNFKNMTFEKKGNYTPPYKSKKYVKQNVLLIDDNGFYVCYGKKSGHALTDFSIRKYNLN